MSYYPNRIRELSAAQVELIANSILLRGENMRLKEQLKKMRAKLRAERKRK